jgi:hypothetical protein
MPVKLEVERLDSFGDGTGTLGSFGTGEFRDSEFRDEVTAIEMPRLRSIDVVRPRTNHQLSTKRKCLLLLALIGFFLRSGFLRRQPAFGLFFQYCGELL